ncbi:hypothetical protein JCM11957_12240 [Caminibacter profundus]
MLLLSKDLGFLNNKDYNFLYDKSLKIGYLLNGLIKSLSKTYKTSTTPKTSNTSKSKELK